MARDAFRTVPIRLIHGEDNRSWRAGPVRTPLGSRIHNPCRSVNPQASASGEVDEQQARVRILQQIAERVEHPVAREIGEEQVARVIDHHRGQRCAVRPGLRSLEAAIAMAARIRCGEKEKGLGFDKGDHRVVKRRSDDAPQSLRLNVVPAFVELQLRCKLARVKWMVFIHAGFAFRAAWLIPAYPQSFADSS